MKCEDVSALLWAYIEQELSAEEAERVEQHLATCEACQKEVTLCKTLAEALHTLPEEALPEGYHTELMQKLQAIEKENNVVPFMATTAKKQQKKQIQKQRIGKQWGMLAAAVLIVVASGGINGLLEQRKMQEQVVWGVRMDTTESSGATESAERMEGTEAEEAPEEGTKMLSAEATTADSNEASAEMAESASGAQRMQGTVSAESPETSVKDTRVMKSKQLQSEQPKEEQTGCLNAGYGENVAISTIDAVLPQETSTVGRARIVMQEEAEAVTEDALVTIALRVTEREAAKVAIQKQLTALGGVQEEATETTLTVHLPIEQREAFYQALQKIGTFSSEEGGMTDGRTEAAEANECRMMIQLLMEP